MSSYSPGVCSNDSLSSRVVPRDRRVVVDHRAAIAELGRPAERDADGLPGPAALDLVAERVGGESDGAMAGGWSSSGANAGTHQHRPDSDDATTRTIERTI